MKLRRTAADSAIPTSSMADIAFLLIIFFMVTSVFSATKGLELGLPARDSESLEPDPQPAVFIHVRADRTLVDCQEIELVEILSYLEPRLSRNPNKPVILYTDPDAAYQSMIQVYDLLSAAGGPRSLFGFRVTNLSVPTKQDIDEYVAMFGENPFEVACL